MGMSASQARLLYLTAQLNNLSLKGQNVSDAKTRLAMDTQAIQDKYIKALNNSRLYLNSNIFASNGAVNQHEYISLENLKAAGLKVSDSSKLLGYSWEEVETGNTVMMPTGEWEDDLTKPIYPTKEVPVNHFEAARYSASGDISAMQGVIATTGLSSDDLEVKSYTTNINGVSTELNAIVIKSQEGFDAIYETLQSDAIDSGSSAASLKQNYVFDVDTVDFSKYVSTGIPYFQGIFDGNGVSIQNLNGEQGLFRDVYGVVKNVNIDGAVINAETDALGGIAGYLGDGGLIENCNVTGVNITCNLKNQDYSEEGYDSERAGIGGVVGYNNGSIKNTTAQGTISVPYADDSFGYIGGFIGANVNAEYGNSENVVENCYSDVDIVLGSNTKYSNSINAFIGDDTYEAIIKNCMSLGSITTKTGKPIEGTDLANWGPVIESNVTNLIALDTRNNNDVLYWDSTNDPNYGNGVRIQPDSIREAQTTLPDGSKIYTWLNPEAEGYSDQNLINAKNNNLPVLNINMMQQSGLTNQDTKVVPDTDAAPIGYQKKQVMVEVAEKEYQLVENADFKISSLALEEGLRSGAYTLVEESEKSTTTTITLNGLYFNTIDLSSCSMITDENDEEAVSKAEAEYRKEMAEIQIKDKRYELDQKKIDTQYQAYMAEEESIKTVLRKNVENSFKTFG